MERSGSLNREPGYLRIRCDMRLSFRLLQVLLILTVMISISYVSVEATEVGRETTEAAALGTTEQASEASTAETSTASQNTSNTENNSDENDDEAGDESEDVSQDGNRNTASGRVSRQSNRAPASAASAVASDEQQEDEESEEEDVQSGAYKLTLIKNANIRTEPSTDSGSKVVVPMGIIIYANERVTGEGGSMWYKVSYGGFEGFLRSDMVEVTDNTQQTEEDGEAEEPEAAEEQQEIQETDESAEEPSEKNVEENKHSGTTVVTSIPDVTGDDSEGNKKMDIGFETDTNAVRRKGIDILFILFLILTVTGLGIAYVSAARLLAEYRRYKRYLGKKRKVQKGR